MKKYRTTDKTKYFNDNKLQHQQINTLESNEVFVDDIQIGNASAKFKSQIMNDIKTDKTDEINGDKILVSFYVSPVTLEKIDDLMFYIKKQLPIARRRSLTKSVFYETGFKILIEEFDTRGEESSLLEAIQELMR